MPRPPVKKTRRLAEAAKIGQLNAERKFRKKESLQERFLRYLEKLIDRVKIDPIELAAMIAGTITVHEIIFKTSEFATQVTALQNTAFKLPVETWKLILSGLSLEGAKEFIGSFAEEQQKLFAPQTRDNLFMWLIAFGIAYFAVRHGDSLLNVAKMFFGKVV